MVALMIIIAVSGISSSLISYPCIKKMNRRKLKIKKIQKMRNKINNLVNDIESISRLVGECEHKSEYLNVD